MIMAKRFTSWKHQRLKSRKLIEQLFDEGKTIQVPSIKVLFQD